MSDNTTNKKYGRSHVTLATKKKACYMRGYPGETCCHNQSEPAKTHVVVKLKPG